MLRLFRVPLIGFLVGLGLGLAAPALAANCESSDVRSRFGEEVESRGVVFLLDRRVTTRQRAHLVGVLEVLLAADGVRGQRAQRALAASGTAIIVSPLEDPLDSLRRRPGLPIPGCTLHVIPLQAVQPVQDRWSDPDLSVYHLARILYPAAILPTERAWARAFQRAAYDAAARGDFWREGLDNRDLGADYFAHGLAAYLSSSVPAVDGSPHPFGRAAFGSVDALIAGDPVQFALLAEFLGDAEALGVGQGDGRGGFPAPAPPARAEDIIPD